LQKPGKNLTRTLQCCVCFRLFRHCQLGFGCFNNAPTQTCTQHLTCESKADAGSGVRHRPAIHSQAHNVRTSLALQVPVWLQEPQQPCRSPVNSREGSPTVYNAYKGLWGSSIPAGGADTQHTCNRWCSMTSSRSPVLSSEQKQAAEQGSYIRVECIHSVLTKLMGCCWCRRLKEQWVTVHDFFMQRMAMQKQAGRVTSCQASCCIPMAASSHSNASHSLLAYLYRTQSRLVIVSLMLSMHVHCL
jgi:hypothetical protein